MLNQKRPVSTDAMTVPPPTTTAAFVDWILAAIVIGAAIATAAGMLAAYAAHPDDLWHSIYNDRHSHLAIGMDFALAIRHLDLPWFLASLEHARFWPPLHGLILGGVMLAGGIDYRLGIVPSLAGWVITVAMVWFITRRLCADRVSGIFGGAVAVVVTMVSPAFRLLSSDVMLEAMGAGLTALAIWAYIAARAEDGNAAVWRRLALLLTALFFYKGNYWGLAAVSIAIAYVLERPNDLSQRARALFAGRSIVSLSASALRDPLLVAFVILSLVCVYLYAWGPTHVTVFARQVKVSPPENLVTIAYALLFLRGALAWRRHRALIDETFGIAGRAIFYWHVVPVAISWLVPKRLAVMLVYVSQANHFNLKGSSYNPFAAVAVYWHGFIDGFHPTPWLGMLVVALAVVGATQVRRLPSGGIVVFVMLVFSAIGVIINPTDDPRYLTSWIFTTWIAAGIGAAALLDWLLRPSWKVARLATATGLVVALVATNIGRTSTAMALRSANRASYGPSDLDLVRPYLAELAGAHEILFAATFGWSSAFRWPVFQYCRCKVRIVDPFIAPTKSREEARNQMAQRIAQTSADVMVIVVAPRLAESARAVGYLFDNMIGIDDAAKQQNRFKLVATYPLPSFDGKATIWRRQADH